MNLQHDSADTFESAADPAHAPVSEEPGANNAGSKAVRANADPRGSREAGARGHEADASDAPHAARAEVKDGEEEIEITEQMIEAGIEAWGLFDRGDRLDWKVSAIFEAMSRAKSGVFCSAPHHPKTPAEISVARSRHIAQVLRNEE